MSPGLRWRRGPRAAPRRWPEPAGHAADPRCRDGGPVDLTAHRPGRPFAAGRSYTQAVDAPKVAGLAPAHTPTTFNVALDGSASAYWATVPADAPSSRLAGAQGHDDSSLGVARDAAGIVQSSSLAAEASPTMPCPTPSATGVDPVETSTPPLGITSSDNASDTLASPLARFALLASVEGGPARLVGQVPVVPGSPIRGTDPTLVDSLAHEYHFAGV